MTRLVGLGLMVGAVAIVGSTSGSSAVSQEISAFGFDLAELSDSGAYFLYRYELSNSPSSTWAIGSIAIDIDASSGTPAPLAATGAVIDATQFGDAPAAPHPYAEVGPIAPTPWRASVTRTAVLRWTAPQPGYQSQDSVSPGDTLSGFGIRSSYLPGVIEVRVAPTLQACCSEPADSTDPDGEFDVPESFSVAGTAVGPRYMPEEIDIDVLQGQLDTVCDDPLWIDDSSLCSEMADSLDAAEARLAINDAPGGRAALVGFRSLIQSNVVPSGDIEVNAAYLLGLNTRQLLTNIGFPTYYP